jgi:DNA polymerase
MFDQAADVVLKTLRDRLSGGARLRASAASISRLRSALADPSAVRPQVPRAHGGQHRGDGCEVVLQERDSSLAACSFCGTADGVPVGRILHGEMNPGELLLVGEAVCSCKDAEFASFGGASGELLLKMLKTMGLTRDSVNMVNVVVCEGTGLGRSTQTLQLRDAMRMECRSSLRELVRKQKPRVIIAMGANAAAAMFESKAPIESSRSVWRDFEGVPAMTTFHAAHLVQNPAIAERRKVWEDLMLVMEKLGIPVSARQRGFFLR